MPAELTQHQLLEVVRAQQKQIEQLKAEIERLKQQGRSQQDPESADSPAPKDYSLDGQDKRERGGRKKKQDSERRGRRTKQEKLDACTREEHLLPDGFTKDECKLYIVRPIHRIVDGRAILTAVHFYRGPNGELPQTPGLLPKSEYDLTIIIAIAFGVYVTRISMDKVCGQLDFFWGLKLSKSQADTLLTQLARECEPEFESICELLVLSAVVHADETSWSIKSAWAFLSETVRVILFGVNKNADVLHTMLPKEVFSGVLVSDNAAVYQGFASAQKCWAHLLRKAIKLMLTEPDNEIYTNFFDELLAIYREGIRIRNDKRYKNETRSNKVEGLESRIRGLCLDRACREADLHETPLEADYRRLCCEILGLCVDEELFVYVLDESVPATNNPAEQGIRDTALDRNADRGSKTSKGCRRRSIWVTLFESLRLHMPNFGLGSVVAEISNWLASGRGLFSESLELLGCEIGFSRLSALYDSPDG